MAWTTNDRVMAIREQVRPFDIFAEMMDGWRRHLSGRNASLLAFFSFLSIFPLMLAGVTILGFFLSGNVSLQKTIIDSAASEIPVLGKTLADNPESIDGSITALIIGLSLALWSSTKAFVGLQGALDDSWEVPVDGRDNLPKLRGKALLGLTIVGVSQVGSLVLAIIVAETELPAVGDTALIAEGDNEAFSTINTILGLITWLSLIGITVIMCAELNAARKRLSDGKHVERGPEMNLAIRN
jgi:uncharacterized BrkB/YihY/UPF0761 family membrane protein